MIERGDIRWYRFSAPDKRRPVLIVGPRRPRLAALSQVPTIPLSTQSRGLPWEVALGPAEGLPEFCVLKPEWIRSVDRDRIGPLIALLPEERWSDVRSALLLALGF